MEPPPPQLSVPEIVPPATAASDLDAAPRTLRLPRFVLDHEIGLGAAVSSLAGAIGLRPCGGCEARARRMDRWLNFAPRRQ